MTESSRPPHAWSATLGRGLLLVGPLVLLGVVLFLALKPAADEEKTPAAPPSFAKEPEVPDGVPWFRDVTAESGIDFRYRNGEEADLYTLLESVGGGVAMIDYDGDGLLDLFFTGGGDLHADKATGRPCKLYKNLGGWKFRDVTAEAGLDKIDFYSHGCAVADYDRDGRPDLVVTGFGRVALFRNVDGKRFVDVTEKAGIRDTSWATSAGWADLSGSGYPDLYVCHYCDWSFKNNPVCRGLRPGVARDVCPPQRFKPIVHALFRNNGDGTFRDTTKEDGLRDDGMGLGVVLADFVRDGRPGIYVANDASNNHLYLNRKGKLEETGLLSGVAVDENGRYNGSMGVDVADYDGSGRAAIFVANFQNDIHALYQHVGSERFSYLSHPSGLAALSRHYVAFGASFIDIDNDGWEDLVVATGHVIRKPYGSTFKQKPLLLRNVASGERRVFRDWSKRGGPFFQTPALGRGLAVGDLDNDGWPDLVISNNNGPAVLLRNEAFKDKPARWLGVQLVGKRNRDVSGTTVTLKSGERTLLRFSKGGGSYLSASDRRILFGLGEAGEVGRLTVRWVWGKEQHFDGLKAGGYWELREGETEARPLRAGASSHE
ncbi:MAG: CRTAC1 family protein [Gemmataceae bacterium]